MPPSSRTLDITPYVSGRTTTDKVAKPPVNNKVDGDVGADVKVGKPVVAGAKVVGEVVKQTRGEKLIVFKKRRRKNSRRKNGHRQDLTVVKITDIVAA